MDAEAGKSPKIGKDKERIGAYQVPVSREDIRKSLFQGLVTYKPTKVLVDCNDHFS